MRTPFAVLVLGTLLSAQTESRLQPGIHPFVSIDNPQVALLHVRVIDGTGASAFEGQTIVIEGGKNRSRRPFRNGPDSRWCDGWIWPVKR